MKFTRRNIFAFLAAPLALLTKSVFGDNNPWFPDPVPFIPQPTDPQITKLREKIEGILIGIGKFKKEEIPLILKAIKDVDQEKLKLYKEQFVVQPSLYVARVWVEAWDSYFNILLEKPKIWKMLEKAYFSDNIAFLGYEIKYYLEPVAPYTTYAYSNGKVIATQHKGYNHGNLHEFSVDHSNI